MTMEQLEARHVFISYSEDGQVHGDELQSILAKFGKVTVHEQPHLRYRSNSRIKDGKVLERLYHVEVF